MRKLLTGAAVGLAVCGTSTAQDTRPRTPLVAPFFCPPAPACPPGTVVPPSGQYPPGAYPSPGGVMPLPGQPFPAVPPTPGNPGMIPPVPPIPGTPPTTPDQPSAPTGPETAPAPQPAATGEGTPQFARGTGGGGFDVDRYNANMFADILGARSLTVTYSVPITAQFGLVGAATTGTGGTAVRVDPNAPGGFVRFGPTPNGTTFLSNANFNNGDLSYVQPTAGGAATFDRVFAQSALQALLSAGQLTPTQVMAFQQLSAADRAQLLANRGAINAQITRATGGLPVPALTVTGVDGRVIDGNALQYTATLTGTQVIALPGASSVVGRVKMSEDNSPLPRDRVIFTYDSFGGVPFTAAGINVNRFQFGVEKTFLDGRWSAEVRLPFAGTLASSYTQGMEVTDTEFGNVRMAFKRLFTQSRYLTTSAGLAISLPTAKDQTVLSPMDFSILYQYRNKSVQLEPFVAALFTPTDRLFGQFWTSMNFDASGSTLNWNPAVFGGTGSAEVHDLPILAVDGQIGYWLIKDGGGALRALAPFAELHWNQTIAQNQLAGAINNATRGQGLTVTSTGTRELNMTAGFMAQVGDNMNVSVGAAVPLLQGADRTFDWQFGVRASYLFGRSARERNPIARVTNY